MIVQGRIAVNGMRVTQLGSTVDPGADRVSVDGVELPPRQAFRTVAVHKPAGYICSSNEGQGQTVYALLGDIRERLVPVGRLDKGSEGLLLMTNDGELANRLMHPRYAHEKIYRVMVCGVPSSPHLRALNAPMTIDGYRTQPAKVTVVPGTASRDGAILEFTLREGRNRQIRHMCREVGLRVTRLVRTSHAGIRLGDLPSGRWRDLTPDEMRSIEGLR